MADNSFKTIEEMIDNILQLPLGSIRALTNFDIKGLIDSKVKLSKKDVARVVGFLPAVVQRAADLGVSVGFEIGLKEALKEGVDAGSVTVSKGAEFDQLSKEATAVVHVVFDQAKHLNSDLTDPFKEEREIVRIFAKRNGLDAGYQKLLGVSDNTKTVYDAYEWFVEKYL